MPARTVRVNLARHEHMQIRKLLTDVRTRVDQVLDFLLAEQPARDVAAVEVMALIAAAIRDLEAVAGTVEARVRDASRPSV